MFLIALFGCCCFCWYRKRNNHARDLENITADTSDTKNPIFLPSTAVNEMEKTGFGHPTTQVAATGEHGLSPQQQVFNAFASSTVPPTPDSSHPLLSAYAANIAPCSIPLPTHFVPESGGFESHQKPLPQIAPSSFKATVNGEAAITGVPRQKHEAREEYKRAVAAGKTAYLLEQEASDGKCFKDTANRTRKLTILQSFMHRWATSSRGLDSNFESLLP